MSLTNKTNPGELVSIMVPVYNGQKYLGRLLDSLIAQSWKHLEIIICDDGSTDGTLEEARKYACRDHRIRIYSYPNGGISANRNRCLSRAGGAWLLFADADDYMEATAVEKMMQTAREHDAQIVQCGYVMNFGPVPFYKPGSGHKTFTYMEALHDMTGPGHLNNYCWGKLVRADCYQGVVFPEDVACFEDTCALMQAIVRAKKIVCIPNRLYHYEMHSGSMTNKMSLERVYAMRDAFEYQKRWLSEKFPEEDWDFSRQLYNTDMVIIYTLIVFCTPRQHPYFEPAQFSWQSQPWPEVWKLAYDAWLGIARLKLGNRILDVSAQKAALAAGNSKPAVPDVPLE